jgi:hypothetical protein
MASVAVKSTLPKPLVHNSPFYSRRSDIISNETSRGDGELTSVKKNPEWDLWGVFRNQF